MCAEYNPIVHLELSTAIGEHASQALRLLPNLKSLYLSVVGGPRREGSLVVLPALPHLTSLRMHDVILRSFSFLHLPSSEKLVLLSCGGQVESFLECVALFTLDVTLTTNMMLPPSALATLETLRSERSPVSGR